MSDWARTAKTASEADKTAALLTRAVRYAGNSWSDVRALRVLAQRYTDYAASLREMIPRELEPEPAENQQGLL